MILAPQHSFSGPVWLSGNPTDDERARSQRGGSPDVGMRSLRVLIVEDEVFIALDMRDVVHELGHTVVGIAISADQAVQVADREKPDIALMDIRLQGARDGIEAAQELLDRFAVPSLFVSANADAQTRLRARTVQCLGFLEKPVNPRSLALALRKLEA